MHIMVNIRRVMPPSDVMTEARLRELKELRKWVSGRIDVAVQSETIAKTPHFKNKYLGRKEGLESVLVQIDRRISAIENH